MKMELNLVTGLHKATKRDYLGRMNMVTEGLVMADTNMCRADGQK